MEKKADNNSVYNTTATIIYRLEQMEDTGQAKAVLSTLRNTIGSSFKQSFGAWSMVFEHIPESYLSRTGEPTEEENAIFHTLQLYALHQQGKAYGVNFKERENMGGSLRVLRAEGQSADRRFNALVTSTNYEEWIHHLRQMVKLLKSKTDARVNYPLLAEDLFWFQKGYAETKRFQWAQSYYFIKTKQEGEENENK